MHIVENSGLKHFISLQFLLKVRNFPPQLGGPKRAK